MDEPIVVGIDVGKDALEVAVSGRPGSQRFGTDPASLGHLVDLARSVTPTIVLVEASGGYEQPVVQACWRAQLPTRRLNAKAVRDFARAMQIVAKTDRIDAGVLVSYGERMRPLPQDPPSPARQHLATYQARRRALVQLVVAEQNRWQQTTDPSCRASITAMIALGKAQIAELEQQMDALIADDPHLQWQAQLIQSVPGLATISARVLLGGLPELGRASAKEIAALAGLAPFNRDSGRSQGTRTISGGRSDIRAALYMPVVSGINCNPVLSGYYQRLLNRGKHPLQALTAAMRKLVVLVNAMLRDGVMWEELAINQT